MKEECKIIQQLRNPKSKLSMDKIEEKERNLESLLSQKSHYKNKIASGDMILQDALYNKDDKYYSNLTKICKK